MVSRIFCFFLLLALANAATWIGRLPMKPKEFAHKEGCYVKEINDVIPFGEVSAPLGVCYRVECSRQFLYYASCGTVAAGDSTTCYVTETDLSRPYPECCPTVACDIDNNLI